MCCLMHLGKPYEIKKVHKICHKIKEIFNILISMFLKMFSPYQHKYALATLLQIYIYIYIYIYINIYIPFIYIFLIYIAYTHEHVSAAIMKIYKPIIF